MMLMLAEMLVAERKRVPYLAARSAEMQRPDRPSAGGVRLLLFRETGSYSEPGRATAPSESRVSRFAGGRSCIRVRAGIRWRGWRGCLCPAPVARLRSLGTAGLLFVAERKPASAGRVPRRVLPGDSVSG